MDQATLQRHLAADAKRRAEAKERKARLARQASHPSAPIMGAMGATVLDASIPAVAGIQTGPSAQIVTLLGGGSTDAPAAPAPVSGAGDWPTTSGTPGTPSPDGGVWGADGFSHDPTSGAILFQPSKAAGGNSLQHKQHVAYVAQKTAQGKQIGAVTGAKQRSYSKIALIGIAAAMVVIGIKKGLFRKVLR